MKRRVSKCWASCLGECSNTISGEHILTSGLFQETQIRVKGFSWCADDFKTIGIGSFTKNVLCVKHNSMLSETDKCAIALRDAIFGVVELTAAREKLQPQEWQFKEFRVSGPLLERWFLKTLITLAVDHSAPIGRASFRAGEPARSLVKIAFGTRTFKPHAGLYWIGKAGKKEFIEGYEVATFTDQSKRVAGARFGICGLEFMLIIDAGQTVEGLPRHCCYRPETIAFSVHDRTSHAIRLDW